MARPRKFNFLPVTNEDLRKRKRLKTAKSKMSPYVRIQKPGILVFPKITLEYFDLLPGQDYYLKFFIDEEKRTLAFKFLDKATISDLKDFKPLHVKDYKGAGVMGMLSIKSILNKLGTWKISQSCEIGEYSDTDFYMATVGKVYYFSVKKEEKVEETVEE